MWILHRQSVGAPDLALQRIVSGIRAFQRARVPEVETLMMHLIPRRGSKPFVTTTMHWTPSLYLRIAPGTLISSADRVDFPRVF